ncbi:hypothetical protein B0H19DRAFT_1250409 [Mycena capillaripes]|nr:hypothetical protein B0H19DRAFT_1250409 [Mycena capillaripes]
MSNRQVIARLCIVSQTFHYIFSAILYGREMIAEPPLTWKQGLLLLIQSLCLPGTYRRTRYLEARDTAHWSRELSGQSIRGAALRVFKWDSEMGSPELGKLLVTPGLFHNLKELSVKCGVDKKTRFHFFRVPDLEKLECTLIFHADEYEEWRRPWRALRGTLGVLSGTSPLLRTFKLVLRLRAYGYEALMTPWNVDMALIEGISQLRLSILRSFKFSLHTLGFDIAGPALDFSPMLHRNPLLQIATLNIDGICVPPVPYTTFLSHLRSFTGSVKNCAAVAARASGLRHITMLFPASMRDDIQNALSWSPESPVPFTPELFSTDAFPGITSLDVRAVDLDGFTGRYPEQLYPASFACLAAAFSNLTHLDVSLGGPLRAYRAAFVTLLKLQHLGVRLHKNVRLSDHDRPASKLFPAADFAAEINKGSSCLRSSPTFTSSFGEIDPYRRRVEYRFRRVGGDEEFQLNEMVVSDGSEWENKEDLTDNAAALYQLRNTFGRGELRRKRRRPQR